MQDMGALGGCRAQRAHAGGRIRGYAQALNAAARTARSRACFCESLLGAWASRYRASLPQLAPGPVLSERSVNETRSRHWLPNRWRQRASEGSTRPHGVSCVGLPCDFIFDARPTTCANPSRVAHRSRHRPPHLPRLSGELTAKRIIAMETPVRDVGAPGLGSGGLKTWRRWSG